jgi:hypothetical protein
MAQQDIAQTESFSPNTAAGMNAMIRLWCISIPATVAASAVVAVLFAVIVDICS